MGHSTAPTETPEFNKYRLREPISDSFLGTRYRAVSNGSGNARAASAAFGNDVAGTRGSAFALRLLRAPQATLIERVARAAKAVRYVDHPNVLAPIQLIRAQTRLGVITQDVDGFTLNEVMRLASVRGEALPQAVALRIALDVLEGAGALHATEQSAPRYTYACGGLTPDSIQVGKDGRARLIDPGVAGAAASVAYWGQDPLALAFTAPEQSGAEPSFNPWSDAFSVGVMIWEMLAGRSLFGALTAAETLENLHQGLIPRVQRQHFVRGEPIAASVALVVAQALTRDPTQRPDCAGLAQLLREAAPSASHIEVAAHCHRLSGSSAGVFEDSPRPRTRGGSSVFELPTGTLSNPPQPLPPELLQLQQQLPAAPEPAGRVVENFEPQTARFHTPDFVPAPPLAPPPPAGPITAFPISDFIRTQPSAQRRQYGAIALAAAVLLGLSYLAWNEAANRPAGSAAAARPGVTVTTISTDPPRAVATPVNVARVPQVGPPENIRATITVSPDTATLGGGPQLPPEADDLPEAAEVPEAAEHEPEAAEAVEPAAAGDAAKRVDSELRRRVKADKDESTPAATTAISNVPAGTFIPDDL